jgi:hypothetical protein
VWAAERDRRLEFVANRERVIAAKQHEAFEQRAPRESALEINRIPFPDAGIRSTARGAVAAVPPEKRLPPLVPPTDPQLRDEQARQRAAQQRKNRRFREYVKKKELDRDPGPGYLDEEAFATQNQHGPGVSPVRTEDLARVEKGDAEVDNGCEEESGELPDEGSAGESEQIMIVAGGEADMGTLPAVDIEETVASVVEGLVQEAEADNENPPVHGSEEIADDEGSVELADAGTACESRVSEGEESMTVAGGEAEIGTLPAVDIEETVASVVEGLVQEVEAGNENPPANGNEEVAPVAADVADEEGSVELADAGTACESRVSESEEIMPVAGGESDIGTLPVFEIGDIAGLVVEGVTHEEDAAEHPAEVETFALTQADEVHE